ncbi:MAG: hypothetical protein JWM88_1896 [Verrucomicrobia bacterium]|nr:hypothetical protein [Verrucomicrobiota bacterium]
MDGQTPESWSEIVAQFDDASLYQTWAYGSVRWGGRNLSHLVIRAGGAVVAAAQLRIARVPVLPAGIAYLRWGPLCQRRGEAIDPAIVREMMSRLQAEYGRRRGFVLQLIPNAFPETPRGDAYAAALASAEMTPQPDVPPYRTVLVDLRPVPDAMRKRLDPKWRNHLNRSEKNGLEFEVSDSIAAYGEFLRLYEVMWQKKQFETSVDVEEFGRIQAELPAAQKMTTFVARKDRTAVAALVCSAMGDNAIYVLGATNDQARELRAAYFLQWQAILWLQQRGVHGYDLGGIDPETNPGGYSFKSGFGGVDVTQLPAHARSSGALGRIVMSSAAWLRRCKAKTNPVAASPA